MDDQPCVRDLSELVRLHSGLLYRYAYRLSGSVADAEDLTQQAFLIAHRKLDQLREAAHAKGWLCAIVRTAYLKAVRKEAAADVVSLERVSDIEETPPSDVPLDSEELQQFLNELSEEFRTPLILYYFQEFSYKEIARQMEVPLGTVMSRLARAKAQLRKRLAACQPVDR